MFFFKRRNRIKVKIFDHGDHFKAMGSTKNCAVWNCYGTTREMAKEIALFRLKQALNELDEAPLD